MIGISLVIILAMATAGLLIALLYAVYQIGRRREPPRGFEVKQAAGEMPELRETDELGRRRQE